MAFFADSVGILREIQILAFWIIFWVHPDSGVASDDISVAHLRDVSVAHLRDVSYDRMACIWMASDLHLDLPAC